MWVTDDGERVLTGKRAAAFAEAAHYLLSTLEASDGEYPTCVCPFDELTYGQKVSCLDAVTRGLLRDDVPVIEPTLPLEATIVAVYGELWTLVLTEIEEPESGTTWRQLAAGAAAERARECGYRPGWTPNPACTDEQLWLDRITSLQREILEDTDELTVESLADLPGMQARKMRRLLGISDEYASTIPDDPNDREIKRRLPEVYGLLRSVAS